MAWGWHESDNAHQQVYGKKKHEGELSHEMIAGAASFEAMKAWEDKQRKDGKPVSHPFAKEAIADIAGSRIDRLAEAKGLDEADKLKIKDHAKENAKQMYHEHYIQGQGAEYYDPNRYARHERIEESN